MEAVQQFRLRYVLRSTTMAETSGEVLPSLACMYDLPIGVLKLHNSENCDLSVARVAIPRTVVK